MDGRIPTRGLRAPPLALLRDAAACSNRCSNPDEQQRVLADNHGTSVRDLNSPRTPAEVSGRSRTPLPRTENRSVGGSIPPLGTLDLSSTSAQVFGSLDPPRTPFVPLDGGLPVAQGPRRRVCISRGARSTARGGVALASAYQVKRIDSDYFSEG
jgi:hypothetical protein